MRSLQKTSRTNPAHPPNYAIPFTNLRSPQSVHCHASRDASKSVLPQHQTRPRPVSSVEFDGRSPRNAWPPVTRVLENQVAVHSTCDSPSRATSLAALPSSASTRNGALQFTPKYRQALKYQTNLVPFSDTPPPSSRSAANSYPHSSALICGQYSFTILHHCHLETPKYQTNLVPFSNTPPAPCRARFRRVGHPHTGAPLALPAKLKLIHSHGGTA
jgi:hypothetical protein